MGELSEEEAFLNVLHDVYELTEQMIDERWNCRRRQLYILLNIKKEKGLLEIKKSSEYFENRYRKNINEIIKRGTWGGDTFTEDDTEELEIAFRDIQNKSIKSSEEHIEKLRNNYKNFENKIKVWKRLIKRCNTYLSYDKQEFIDKCSKYKKFQKDCIASSYFDFTITYVLDNLIKHDMLWDIRFFWF